MTPLTRTPSGRIKVRSHTDEEKQNLKSKNIGIATFTNCTTSDIDDIPKLIYHLVDRISYRAFRDICASMNYNLSIHTVEEVTEFLIRDIQTELGSSCLYALNDYLRETEFVEGQ